MISLSYRRWEVDWRLQVQPCNWVWDERPWVDAWLPRFGGLVERWVLLHWTGEVCNRDLEEIQDGGLQAYGHTSIFQLEEDWCIRIRRIWSYLVSSAYRIAYVSGQHSTRHQLCSQLMVDPRRVYWTAAKHILHYIRGTVEYGMVYECRGSAISQILIFSNVLL